jgi:hypothetical protein
MADLTRWQSLEGFCTSSPLPRVVPQATRSLLSVIQIAAMWASGEKPNDQQCQWETDTQRTANYQRKRQKQTYPSPQLMQ